MSNGFFSGSNPLFRLTGRFLDLVVLSFFFLLASLPVVTLGPAAAALYYSSVKCLRRGEGSPYRSFWASFRENLRPGIGALAIFTFINAWNEYPLQLIMLSKTEAKTIALGIAGLQSEMSNDFGLIMAGAALAAVPIILVFLAFQRYFTQGITMGAVKG